MTVLATAVWRVRPSGSNTNGGGYDPGIAGAATDYSQQNGAQATGTNGSATGTATFTDLTALAFTSAMIGNAVYITGGGLTTGFYFITGFTSSSVVTLDRTPGTGTLATWNLGGGWADWWTNLTATANIIVPGNTVYVLGTGTPNPSSYSFDYNFNTGVTTTLVSGTALLSIVIANDPGTPGYGAPPITTAGMPVTQITGGNTVFAGNFIHYRGMYFVINAALGVLCINNAARCTWFGCVLDQNGYDYGWYYLSFHMFLGCEAFSSASPVSTSNYSVLASNQGSTGSVVIGCNIHDTVGPGFSMGNSCYLLNSIVAKCRGDGVSVVVGQETTVIMNNTIDGNTGHGIYVPVATTDGHITILNNIITNHTGGGKVGMNILITLSGIADYNSFYNNTTNYGAGTVAGPHDTVLGSDPYVGQATEDYTLA